MDVKGSYQGQTEPASGGDVGFPEITHTPRITNTRGYNGYRQKKCYWDCLNENSHEINTGK